MVKVKFPSTVSEQQEGKKKTNDDKYGTKRKQAFLTDG